MQLNAKIKIFAMDLSLSEKTRVNMYRFSNVLHGTFIGRSIYILRKVSCNKRNILVFLTHTQTHTGVILCIILSYLSMLIYYIDCITIYPFYARTRRSAMNYTNIYICVYTHVYIYTYIFIITY